MRLFTQPWEGDVTILLPWRLYSKSISKVIHNPEQFELINADREGILAAWAHMSAIQVCSILFVNRLSCQLVSSSALCAGVVFLWLELL